ncbi:uncharacterized protein EI90DRAFT_3179477 [Cantharellus anzutake]|uniref:uncharacterized protein n=1 Tax=Cantharellus anzutake TaxID=1750568 RepID=UPI0019052704|nr:uncharacterized protein EI90DRAFT_3179477 [Cantharellus anzutake]KAF8313900.1 hypothetical protein EI90DRAFT_3179477 [Cantharellus anzutake]
MAQNGTVQARSQLNDYMLRGTELEGYSLYNFLQDTYEEWTARAFRSGEANDAKEPGGRGRPRHTRSSYGPKHRYQETKRRVVRENQHNTVVDIVGTWIPRVSTDGNNDLYYASLLMLWKSWRGPKDLKTEGESWKEAYQALEQQSPTIKHFASNAQYRYECKEAADKDEREAAWGGERGKEGKERNAESDGEEEESEGGDKGEETNVNQGTIEQLSVFIASREMTDEVRDSLED